MQVLYMDADFSTGKYESYVDKLPASAIAAYKSAPLTSVNVERSFPDTRQFLETTDSPVTPKTSRNTMYNLLYYNSCD